MLWRPEKGAKAIPFLSLSFQLSSPKRSGEIAVVLASRNMKISAAESVQA
jgi:hypothetical protein